MDLREVLADSFFALVPDRMTRLGLADAALARLSQPDVLDEFERRVAASFAGDYGRVPAENARRVLADMLGGGS